MTAAEENLSHRPLPATAHPGTPSLTTTNPFPPWSKLAIASFVLVVVLPISAIALTLITDSRGGDAYGLAGQLLLMGAFAGIPVGLVLAFVARWKLKKIAQDERPRGGAFAVVALVFGGLYGAFIGLIIVMAPFMRGRQVRSGRKALLADVDENDAWLKKETTTTTACCDDEAAAIADQWRENGKTEHASVAAFARLSLDLLALGAPKALIDDAHKDALDESRHTELCFGHAQHLDGAQEGPAAFPGAWSSRAWIPVRSWALARLAVDSLIDGAINEGVSARTLAGLFPVVADERTRAMIKGIAKDEAHHAAHAWQVLVWCKQQGGPVVDGALRGAMKILAKKKTQETTAPPAAKAGAWEVHGIPSDAREQGARDVVVMQMQARLHHLLAA